MKERAAVLRNLLLGWEELLQREHRIEETKTLFGKTDRTYILAGWVPSKKTKDLAKTVEKECPDTVALDIVEFKEPIRHGHAAPQMDAEVETRDRPPTRLTNPKSLRSYEDLTSAFGVPSHREIDPTWFMAIGFPLIFGLMFGDIGHGAILFFFAILGMIAYRRGMDLGELGNYFLKGAGLIAVIALSSVFFGVLYGEFLGLSIAGLPWYIDLKASPFGQIMRGFLLNLFTFFDFDAGVSFILHPPHGGPGHELPIWFSAFETPDQTWILFVLSIIIGVIHLSIAIFIDLINKVRHKEYKQAIFGPLIWLWFF